MKKTMIGIGMGLAGSLMIAGTAQAADSCNKRVVKDQNLASKFDDTLSRSKGWQYPRTSFCIFYSSEDKWNQKYDGRLFQKDGRLTFVSTDGDDGRSELRGYEITDRQGYLWGDVRIGIDPGGKRQFTVGQLFGKNNSNGKGVPIVRIEVYDGKVRAVVRKTPTSSARSYGNVSVSNGSRFNYEVRQYRKRYNGKNRYFARVKINGTSVFDGVLGGYDYNDTYTKAGCYMNNATEKDGCRSEFYNLNASL